MKTVYPKYLLASFTLPNSQYSLSFYSPWILTLFQYRIIDSLRTLRQQLGQDPSQFIIFNKNCSMYSIRTNCNQLLKINNNPNCTYNIYITIIAGTSMTEEVDININIHGDNLGIIVDLLSASFFFLERTVHTDWILLNKLDGETFIYYRWQHNYVDEKTIQLKIYLPLAIIILLISKFLAHDNNFPAFWLVP